MGLPVDIEPDQALWEELHRCAGVVAWLGHEVQALEREQLTGPVGGGPHAFPSAEPNVIVRMWQEERDRLIKVAKTCIDVGLDERRVRAVERDGERLAVVIRAVVAGLGRALDDPVVQLVVRKALTAGQTT